MEVVQNAMHVHNSGKDKISPPQQEVRVCGKKVLAEFTQLGVELVSEWKNMFTTI